MNARLPVISIIFDDDVFSGESCRSRWDNLSSVIQWYEHLSRGRLSVCLDGRTPVKIAARPHAFSQVGGLGHYPYNTQRLAEQVLQNLSPSEKRALALSPEKVVFLVPRIFHPHTWHLKSGGFHLGRGRWCRRYTVLPEGASKAVIAHELGHLLFNWPDLKKRQNNIADHCLMGTGALNASELPLPCAPLRVWGDWCDIFTIDKETKIRQVNDCRIGVYDRVSPRILVERQPHGDRETLYIYQDVRRNDMPSPRLLDAVELTPSDRERTVLSQITSAVRSVLSG